MNAFQYTGKIVSVGKVLVLGNKGFKKRTIVVSPNADAQYPDYLVCDLKSGKYDNTRLVTEDDLGRTVTVSYFPEGRKWVDQQGVVHWFGGNSAVRVAFANEDNACSSTCLSKPAQAPAQASLLKQNGQAPDDIGVCNVGELPF